MELLLDKESVFLTETVFDGQTEQGVELDYILPDYYPDIFKILKCSLTPSIVSYNISGSQLYIDGVVYVKVLYTAEDGEEINCIDQRYTYSKTVELAKNVEMPRVSFFPKADYCNCRAISGRRIDIRGAVSCKIRVCGCFENEILCGVSGLGTEVKKNDITYCESSLFTNRQYVVREDIETGTGGSIVAVLSVDCTASVSETKIISDKVIVKGDAKVKSLYLVKNSDGKNTTEVMEATVPLSQIIDLSGVTDSHNCYAVFDVMDCDLEIKQSDEGASRVLGCDITVDCKVSAYKEAKISPVCDLYSTDYDIEYTSAAVKIEHAPKSLSCQSGIRTTLDYKEGKISEILDCKCDILGYTTKSDESGRLTVSGQLLTRIIGRDDEKKPLVFDKSEDFAISPDIEINGTYSVNPTVTVGNISYNINEDNTVEIRLQLSLCGTVNKVDAVNTVNEITVDKDKPKKKDNCYGLKMYFAEANESVWDISKKYNTAVSAVMTENELSEEVLSEACMLLIPMV